MLFYRVFVLFVDFIFKKRISYLLLKSKIEKPNYLSNHNAYKKHYQ